uniref:Uncharacterized protein n=1 Tax=Oryza glumipatula TaxID=40148 RepID=A0A0D9ZHX5_9ORYZ
MREREPSDGPLFPSLFLSHVHLSLPLSLTRTTVGAGGAAAAHTHTDEGRSSMMYPNMEDYKEQTRLSPHVVYLYNPWSTQQTKHLHEHGKNHSLPRPLQEARTKPQYVHRCTNIARKKPPLTLQKRSKNLARTKPTNVASAAADAASPRRLSR